MDSENQFFSMQQLTQTVDYDYDYNGTDPFGGTGLPKIDPFQIVTLVCYGLVFILGVPGNALVVWVTGFGMSRTVTSIWFLNLSLADLLCCLSLPILMVPLAHDDHWHFGPIACTLFKSLFYLVMHCSVLLLVLISVDRCMLVSWPVWCQNNRRPGMAVWACGGAWVLALLATIPELLFTREEALGKEKKECLGRRSQVNSQIIIGFRFVFGFLLAFVAIVLSHVVVYIKASSLSGSIRSKRTLKVIIAVSTSFFFCWLPLHITDILITLHSRFSPHRHKINKAHSLALCLAYFNSCLNPILYVCLGRDFRSSMNRTLRSHFNFIREEPTCREPSATLNSSGTATAETTSV
ncbi:C5a anaphylatoxin chemotactic receptor 1 isoform X1 [Gadus morhua]|uniref:C5a anaphylatoxin chemotactic receptor 1 isoform X1 n=1 Tax=Gadus morhua TaxID=8049 RepID=UPI0011B63F0A|nr:C5a anaphylatoxin chemotactic receptor 1-like isoform X1 [Gadus morhua]